MNTFHLCVLASDKPFYDGDCQSLVIPMQEGQYGIQAHHRNMIAAMIPGILSFTDGEGNRQIASSSFGMVKVENNNVLILVDTAERPEEIDANRARQDAEAAKEEILQKKSIQDYRSAQARMARALSRLKAKELYNG